MIFSNVFYKTQFQVLFVVSNLFAVSAFSSTVMSPSDAIKLESLSVKCSEPGKQCPQLPVEDVVEVKYFNVDDEYSLTEESIEVASEAGLLVSYKVTAEPQVIKRFFPMSKVNLSPDSEFYMCGKGREFSIDDKVDLSSIGMSEVQMHSIFESGYQPMTFVCKCFWAPQHLFDELGIKKFDKKLPNSEVTELLFSDLVPGSVDAFSPGNSQTYDNNGGSSFYPIPEYPSPFDPFPHHPVPPILPPTVPIAAVGSPCGLLQFRCAFNLYFYPKERKNQSGN